MIVQRLKDGNYRNKETGEIAGSVIRLQDAIEWAGKPGTKAHSFAPEKKKGIGSEKVNAEVLKQLKRLKDLVKRDGNTKGAMILENAAQKFIMLK